LRYSCMYVFKMMSVWTFVNVYVGIVFEKKITPEPHMRVKKMWTHVSSREGLGSWCARVSRM